MGFGNGPWARLLIHALLRGSRIFPGLELCDDPPNYTSVGFTDIWKGEYHGELVCIKATRGDPNNLEGAQQVRNRFIQSEVYQVRFVLEMPSCDRREHTQPSSERAPHHPGFECAVSALHYESVDAKWEYYSVYPSQYWCQPSDACTYQLVEICGSNLTTPAIACTSVPWPYAPSWVGYFPRQY